MARVLLFHLSDLHIGSHHLGTESWHSGFFGHHFTLLTQLKIAIANAKIDLNVTAEDKLLSYVGGDLARVGGDYDFHLAFAYLLSELTWTEDRSHNQRRLGLKLPHRELYTVPGNHDHWNGYRTRWGQLRPPAYNPGIFPDFFQRTPWRHSLSSPTDAFALELFGVDSNSGLQNQQTNLRAGGAFSQKELFGSRDGQGNIVDKGLEQLLNDADQDQQDDGKPRAAVILCHHALLTNQGPLSAQPLNDWSRQELLKLARKYKVRAILTGHTHYFVNFEWTGGKPHVWEIRCGTSLQLASQMPYPLPKFRHMLAPGFLVHEFTLATDPQPPVSWNVWKYQWDGTTFRWNPTPFNVP